MDVTKRVSVAPMLDWTDRHCRYFHRLLNKNVYLYTEMITTGAIIHGDKDRHLGFNNEEHPLVLQLGGSEPNDLSECAKIAESYGYDEINLNCGCPSDRVQNGMFGACLMKTPSTVARCIESMNKSVDIPVTIKCRIGIDDCEELSFLDEFINTTSSAGCERFIVHARKAWLQGLSPKENRDIPPLRYDIVEEISQKYPNLVFELNGGLNSAVDIEYALRMFDGAMIGREAYSNPYFLSSSVLVDKPVDKGHVVADMVNYISKQLIDRHLKSAHNVTRHMIGFLSGEKGARHWRRTLSEKARFCESLESVTMLFKEALIESGIEFPVT